MAVNKTAGVTKVKLGSSTKKAAVIKKASPEEGRCSQKEPGRPLSQEGSPKKAVALKKAKLLPRRRPSRRPWDPS